MYYLQRSTMNVTSSTLTITSIAATLTGQRSERADSRLLVAEVTGLPITKDTHRLKMYTAQWITLCGSPSAELMTKTTKMTLTVIATDG